MSISCVFGRVSDPKATCGVITSPPIRGQNVTLSCSMAYRYLAEKRRLIPGVYFSASISWESAAGTLPGRTSPTAAVTNSDGDTIGETRQVDATTLANGAVIPSYNCTTTFSFTDNRHSQYTLALNDLSWTCVSKLVITWCMHFSRYFKLLRPT